MGLMQRLLAVLDEPALLVTAAGAIRGANGPALRLVGCPEGELVGRPLHALAAEPEAQVQALLRRFSGVREPMIGSMALRLGDGAARKFRCRGGRVSEPTDPGEPLVLLRLEEAEHDRFRLLTGKVVALNDEIRRSRLAQHQLEAALKQKETLLRELHHRVKNNLQVLLGILLLGEQRAKAPEALAAIHDARLRVEAMALLQRLVYHKDDLARVDSGRFLEEICASVERAFQRPGIAVRAMPAEGALPLDLASAAGLILNELLTNALKHAFPGREEGEVKVRLALEHEEEEGTDLLTLVVEDDGCGLGEAQQPGTGLMLARGLAQQHGGSCRIETDGGTRCVVTLRHRQRPAPERPLR